ncbi:MAG: hypothetical protein AB7K09_03320 [Planctomycetota bacterium]
MPDHIASDDEHRGDADADDTYVPIARFNSAHEAQMARGALVAAGFLAELDNQFSQVLVGPVDFFGGHGGHMISVPQSEVRDAIDLLRQTPAANNLIER